MRLSDLARSLFRRPAAAPVRRSYRVKLGVETFEDRVVPAVTGLFDAANGILTLNAPTVAGDNVTLSAVGANLNILSTNGFTSSVGLTVVNATNQQILATSVKKLVIEGTATVNLGFNGANVAASLQNVATNVTELNITERLGLAVNLAPLLRNVYTVVDLAGTSSLATQAGGVTVVKYTSAAAGTFAINTAALTTGVVGLDFRGAVAAVGAAGVNINLNSTTLGGYGAQLITATDPTKITAVYGSNGNDVIIGNDNPNYLVGGLGDDILVGKGGNDQLNATRDFAPAIAGTAAAGGGAATNATTVIDLTRVLAATGRFNTLQAGPGGSATAAALYTAFGLFNFGEGGAFLAGGASDAAFATAAGADFAFANTIVPPAASKDFLYGGDGNDGIYGFNGTSVIGYGEAGNDVFSTNLKGSAGTFDGGTGDDLLIGASGFTVVGGAGNDNLSFVADPASTALTYAIGGDGNDTISAALRFVTVDASQGLDTIAMSNDATAIMIFNGTAPPPVLAALPLVQKATR